MSHFIALPQALRGNQARLPDPGRQRVTYKPEAWLRQFGRDADVEDLVAHFPGTVTRGDVVGVAQAALRGTTSIRRAFLASMIWGYGTVGYGAFRTARMLRTPDAAGQLARASSSVTAGRLADATEDFALQGCGLAFVSKFLYFIGLGSGQKPLPLILDSRVEAALTTLGVDLTQQARERAQRAGQRYSLSTRRYLAYVDLANAWAQQIACRPDQIEMWLFGGLGPAA